MAWAQIHQAGAELGLTAEMPVQTEAASIATSTSQAYTGLRSFLVSASTAKGASGWTFTSAPQISMHCYLRHGGMGSGAGGAQIFSWISAGTTNNSVRYNRAANVLEIYVNNAQVASIDPITAGFSTLDTWRSCGVIVKADATTGWVSFYLDGSKVLTATAINTGTGITSAFISGWTANLASWNTPTFFDDIVLYSSAVGTEPDVAPVSKRFLYSVANAAGASAAWSRSAGAVNYELVDEVPSDGDTTYVYAASAGLVDAYNTADITLPAGWSISAAIPVAIAKRTSTTETLRVGLTDGPNTSAGDAQTLTADYTAVKQRYTTQPNTTAWNVTAFNAMQARIESAGTY